jgi:hypothetical protein
MTPSLREPNNNPEVRNALLASTDTAERSHLLWLWDGFLLSVS